MLRSRARIETILLETDVPELLLARDTVGALYLAILAESERDGDKFLVLPISAGRLADLRLGQIDLLSVVTAPEMPHRYSGVIVEGNTKTPSLLLSDLHEVPPAWLPGPGFLLSAFTGEKERHELVTEAVARGTPLVTLSMHPPEARESPKVNADRLAGALSSFQSLVKHALAKALKGSKAWKEAFSGTDGHIMQVYAFGHGSFEVHLQGLHGPDLAGDSALGRALRKVDELTALLGESDEAAIDGVRQNKGHVVAAYRSLLRFVIENETALTYHWAEPIMPRPHGGSITTAAAARLYELLGSRQELSVEETVFVGTFTKVDTNRGTWALQHEEGHTQGEVHESTPGVLQGLTVTTASYRIECEERLEEVVGTGRTITRYFLKKVELLSVT